MASLYSKCFPSAKLFCGQGDNFLTMLKLNTLPEFRRPLDVFDAHPLRRGAAVHLDGFLRLHCAHRATPLYPMHALADQLGIGALQVKDESCRLGMGSFKALGGSYASVCLVLEEASIRLKRPVNISELQSQEVRAIAATMTLACATDGNHGLSVAYGARLTGATATIFVHGRVSEPRVASIRNAGAEVVRVEGTYDDAVAQASRACAEYGWLLVSDTSWPGYERVPRLVMQGYTAMVREIVEELSAPPTHVFLQAGVGGLAAAVAAYLADAYGNSAPSVVVVEPERAACLFESARAGQRVKIHHGKPTIMAMLECYEPSLVAWRILSRLTKAFMTVSEKEAIDVMRRLANPVDDDPAIVAGESGGVGLAGVMQVCCDRHHREAIGLGGDARVLVINTEGATDPLRYAELVGPSPIATRIHSEDDILYERQ